MAITKLSALGVPGPARKNPKNITGTGAITLPSLEISGSGGEPNHINDIIITDGLATFAAKPSNRNGLFSQKMNNEVKDYDDLIKMWDGLGSL